VNNSSAPACILHWAIEVLVQLGNVKGLDGVFVGSGDLKLSLTGKAGHGTNSTLFDDAIDKILASCQKNNIVPGIWCASIEAAQVQQAKGYRFIALQSDSMILNDYAKKLANELKTSMNTYVANENGAIKK